jgi:phosphoglycolate phosphatase-like HAD superfamily hydrolase
LRVGVGWSIGNGGLVTKVVLWDFDETLAERPGHWWGCMLEIMGRRHPDCVADEQALREALRDFYPWRFPEVVHEHLNDPDDWWAALQPGLATAAVAAGLHPLDADAVAAEVRSCYAMPEAFRLYDDTTEALRMFRDAGWRQAIVSNHCPELESLVGGLGIGAFFDKVYSSACTGYEKPHPRSIGLALEYFEGDVVWMIGNSARRTHRLGREEADQHRLTRASQTATPVCVEKAASGAMDAAGERVAVSRCAPRPAARRGIGACQGS